MSGYRDGEKKEFHITTDYSKVYAHYIAQGEIQSIEDLEMTLIIHVTEIISATRFDYKIFEQFTLTQRPKSARRKRKTSQSSSIAAELINN